MDDQVGYGFLAVGQWWIGAYQFYFFKKKKEYFGNFQVIRYDLT